MSRAKVLVAAACVCLSWLAQTAAAADDPAAAARKIDALLKAELHSEEGEAQPAGLADDATFVRRTSLDISGRTPAPGEVAAFAFDFSPDKRARLVDQLLASPEYGENWGRYWRDAILYHRTEERALLVSESLQNYLQAEFNRNTPWDEIASSFVTATGDVREVGSTAVIMSQMGETSDTAAEFSRLFLGIQIQCAQCHDHKFDRWKRTQFHELAAFFPRVEIRNSQKNGQRTFEVVANDNARKGRGKNNKPRANQEHYMPDLENPQAQGTLMQPVFFVSGEKLPLGTPDAERRETVARWITSADNPWFSKALVNRVWAELVGEGFYETVDDIGPDRSAYAPDTLNYLAAEFVASGYDLKWLMRTVMATEAYQRDSRTRRSVKDQPFLANCPQRLRADQLFDSLLSALGVNEPASRGGGRYAAAGQNAPRGRFAAAFGYDPSSRRDEVAGSIPQTLLLMNGAEVNKAISGPQSSLKTLLAENQDNKAVVVELYLRSFARPPQPQELQTCLMHVKQTQNRREAFEDIQWALINSTEFLFRK